jgi:hypothetical protein
MTTKDSLFNLQKTQNIQTVAYREQMRQNDIEIEKTKAEQERKENIQYAILAIGIIIFLLFLLFLSRSIIVKEKWVSFLGVLGLLVVFEFINLLIHPTLELYTKHSPAWMLIVLVAIAAVLIPMHHRLEKKIKQMMVEKNKKIRLDAARRTIEELEGH